MLDRIRRSCLRWKARLLLRRDVVHEHEVNGLVHRFSPETHPTAKAQYRFKKGMVVSSPVKEEIGDIILTEEIEYFLYEHDADSAEELHSSLLHATLHELTHWALDPDENRELSDAHSYQWYSTFEGIINYLNDDPEMPGSTIEVTFDITDGEQIDG